MEVAKLVESAAASFKLNNFQDAAEQLSICLQNIIKGKEIDQLGPEDNISLIAFLHLKYGLALLEVARDGENVLGESIISKDVANTNNFINTEDNFEEISDVDVKAEEDCPAEAIDLSTFLADKSENALQIANNICDDLQLAWEALDTARILYQRVPSDKSHSFLIDVYDALSEVCMESENWDGAQENLKLALNLAHSSAVFENKRLLAELYFKLALVSEYSSKYDDAISLLLESKSYLSTNENASDDLKQILMDIDAKIEELNLAKKSAALNPSPDDMGSACHSSIDLANKQFNNTRQRSISDITGLIRKKSVSQNKENNNN